MSDVSPLRRGVATASIVLAALGPVAGLLVLWFGELPLWGAPANTAGSSVASAGVWLGTWSTLVGLGMLGAAPFRLAAGLALLRNWRWQWPTVALAGVIGCLDSSFGILLAVAMAALWHREASA